MRASRHVLANEPITATRGMVVAQHPLGARAGLEVLARGGNAVDAAVTTAFAMGVVQPLMNGIGGGGQRGARCHRDLRRLRQGERRGGEFTRPPQPAA